MERKQIDFEVLQHNADKLDFEIYPNPAVDQLILQHSLTSKAQYQILDTTGILIKTGSAADSKIDVSQLASGLYILSVQDLNGIRSTKFYKN